MSRTHRDNRDLGCTLTALSCDAARQPDEVKVEFEEGIEQLIQFIMNERAKQVSLETEELRKQAINILAQSVGQLPCLAHAQTNPCLAMKYWKVVKRVF